MLNTTIKIELDKRSTKKDGTHPLKLRVTINRKPIRIPLGYSIEAKYWDERHQTVRTSCKSIQNVTRLNTHLQKRKAAALDVITKLQDSGELASLSPADIKERIYQKPAEASVLEFCQEVIDELEQLGKAGNARVYRTLYNSLKNYLGEKDVPFRHITYKWLKKYEAWYLTREHQGRKNTINGLGVHMRTLRALFNRAIKQDLISRAIYPFEKYTIQKAPTRKRAITRADIAKLEAFEPQTDRQRRAKEYFLMSFYLMGASFVDLAMLKGSDIQEGRIQYQRRKTGKLYNIKMSEPLWQLLLPHLEDQLADSFVLPIIKSADPKQQLTEVRDELRRYNRTLKEIGKLCGIEKVLTSYVSRHSFATIAKHKGVPVEAISEALGHSDVRTTQIYLDQFETGEMDAYHDLIIGID